MIEYDDLNDGQKEAYDKIMNLIPLTPYDADERIIGETIELVLEGFAGSGKTTLISLVIRDLKRRGYRVFVCAPTHKATQQLERTYSGPGMPQLDFIGTIHSALGLKLEPEEDKQVLKQTGIVKTSHTPSWGGKKYLCDILVCDEGSMVSGGLHSKMLARQKEDRFHIINVGDDYQLEPVDEAGGKSTVFGIKNKAKLHCVTRQAADSPIIQFSAACREKIDFYEGKTFENKPFSFGSYVNGKEIQTVKTAQIVDKYLELIEHKSENAEKHRILSFTNDRVDAFNRLVRKRLLGNDAPEFVEGEIVILQDSTESFSNNQEVRIKSVCEDLEVVELPHQMDSKGNVVKYLDNEFEVFKVTLQSLEDEDLTETVNILGVNARDRLDEWLGKFARHYGKVKRDGNKRGAAVGWKAWWEMRSNFPSVKPAFATTVHKSQGSTFDNVIFDLTTTRPFLQSNPSTAWRLIYVAGTRPRHTFFIGI